jgi:acid-sensing ion channel, other
MIKYTAGFTNPINKLNLSELPALQEILQANRFTVDLAMKRLMYPCTKMIHRCRWEGKIVDCKQMFSISETYQGYCCSFNILKPGFAVGKAPKIRKTHYFGPESGLSVILSPKIENEAMTSVNSEGMKILVNHFNLYPSERSLERMLPHKQDSYVEIRPERTDCSETVKALPISDRGCVFEDEHQLKHFPKYAEENCRVECNMDLHVKTCDCLPYFFYNTENAEICSFTQIECMVNNRGKLKMLLFIFMLNILSIISNELFLRYFT